jgi:hypothetical protein
LTVQAPGGGVGSSGASSHAGETTAAANTRANRSRDGVAFTVVVRVYRRSTYISGRSAFSFLIFGSSLNMTYGSAGFLAT